MVPPALFAAVFVGDGTVKGEARGEDLRDRLSGSRGGDAESPPGLHSEAQSENRRARMSDDDLELGPVDIVVIGYPADAPRTGEAIPIFVDLVNKGIIRVLDVLLVNKSEDGTVAGIELSDLGDGLEELQVFEGARTGMLGDEDADVTGEALEPGESAVMICFENAWAAPFTSAVRRNGGQVLAFERIPAQDVLETVEALEAI
jgi:hypothetical protein